MTLLLVFITLIFTVFTLYKTVSPFLGSRHGQLRVELLDDELRNIELLVARKTALVQSLRELEYDWQTSKISDEDYERFKKSYERQAIGIMRRLDAIHGGRAWEQNIDAELARRLQDPALDDLALDDLALDDLAPPAQTFATANAADLDLQSPAASPEHDASATDNTCEQCEKPLLADDVFCARCGHRVAPTAAEHAVQTDDDVSAQTQTSNKSLRPEITQ